MRATTYAGAGGGEVDVTSGGASGVSNAFPIVLTAGDAAGSGLGGDVTLAAGGSGSGTAGNINLTSAGLINLTGAVQVGNGNSLTTPDTNTAAWSLKAYNTTTHVDTALLTITSANPPTLALVTPTIASFVNATHNHQAAAGGGTLAEAALALTDVTTANVSATAHGFAPKFPNNTTTFLRGDGTYATPASSGVTSIATTSPITGGTITATGTIACATCGVTGTGLQQFAATTSAQFAGVISDESGTGLVILQTSPTIITPTIASLANATHNHSNAAGGGSSIGPLTGGLTLSTGDFTVSAGNVLLSNSGSQIAFTGGPGTLTNTSGSASSTLTISTANINGANTAPITIKTGSIASFGGNAGGVTVDTGSTNSGTNGTISLGTANAGAVSIGRNGINTTINEYVTSGTAPTVANVGANSCGTTAASIAGDDNSGNITVGATSGTQCRIVFAVAAPTRRNCTASDETTGNLMRTTYVDTTHTDILGTMIAADVISYICFAR